VGLEEGEVPLNVRFWLAWLIVAVLWFGGVYLINAVLIIADWYPVEILRGWEGELAVYQWMVIPFFLWSGAAVWIYQNFERRQAWLQRGLAYGLVLALITDIPMRMFNYAAFKLPGLVLVKEAALWTVMSLVIGVVIAWTYRVPKHATVPLSEATTRAAKTT
jgi:hypothetical protein